MYFREPHKHNPDIFNQIGFSYTQYRKRRKASLTTFFSSVLAWVAYLTFTSILTYQTIQQAPPVLAADTPWTQTDWSGGAGTSTTTEYTSISNIYASTTGQFEITTTSNWYDANWPYRIKITIDQNQVSSTLTNFPALITEANLPDHFFTHKQKATSTELVFTSSDGVTKLDREVVEFASTTNKLEAWVRIPSLPDDSDTDIYMYYGNAGATETDDVGTWNAVYDYVFHLNEDPTLSPPQHIDSVGSGENLSRSGDPATSSTGKIGNAVDFDGTGDDLRNLSPSTESSEFTLSAWFKGPANSDWGGMIGYSSSDNIRHEIGHQADGSPIISYDSDDPVQLTVYRSSTAGSVHDNQFHYIVGSDDDSDNTKLYVDGVAVGLSAEANAGESTTGPDLVVGNLAQGGAFNIVGLVDEARMTSSTLSAQWIETEYNNQSDPSTFYSTSAMESVIPTTTTNVLTSAIFNGDIPTDWGTLTYTATGVAASTTVKIRTGDQADLSDADDFSTCSGITSGSDTTSDSCVTDGEQYVQYEVTLTTDGITTNTPTFQDFSLAFSPYLASTPVGLSASTTNLTTLNVSWSTEGNFDGVQYYAEINGGGETQNSGWTTDTNYTFTAVEGVVYQVSVKARNPSLIETAAATIVAGTPDGGGGAGSRAPTASINPNTGQVQAIFSINDEAEQTTTTDVTLHHNVIGAQMYRVSNDPIFRNKPFSPLTHTSQWTLTPATGTKTVYVQYLSNDNAVIDVSDTIVFIDAAQQAQQLEQVLRTSGFFGDLLDRLLGKVNVVDGDLVQADDATDIYLIEDQQRRLIATPRVFTHLNLDVADIHIFTADAINAIPLGTPYTMADVGPYLTDLQFPDQHPDIRTLKELFHPRYYFLRDRTTDFTSLFEDGIKRLQQENNLPITGIFDRNTRAFVNQHIADDVPLFTIER